MNYSENSSFHSRELAGREQIMVISNNEHYSPAEGSISNKWNNFFMNSSGSETDVESNSSSKSVRASYASSSCSSTSLEGLKFDDVPAEQMRNTNNSPTVRGISLVTNSPKRKSDGLCRLTVSGNPSTYQYRVKEPFKPGFSGQNEMETSRLDDSENHCVSLPLQPHSPSRLNVEEYDRMEKLKISNGENGMLKSVKGTVRGYKNMVRRYSASFNSKGHVISPTEQMLNDEDMKRIIIFTTSMTAVRATTDACSYVKKVFRNRGIAFEERDVFIHKEHQKEMQKLLGKVVILPQVIINGIHVGGLKEVEELNESGKLSTLISGFERCYSGKECERCGGRRFINCLACGGSKTSRKHRIIREICSLRCTSCNENGLTVCPDCAVEPSKD